MAKREWTDSQRMAINAKGGSVIVSAAAGSGKTAVLVERVISMITDIENPVDADRILVVTYTRAAAAELRERLQNKLNELIRNDPFNKALLRQQSLMSKANISTIDSFCSSVVKEFFYLINIERNFRIADDSELSLIKNDALKLTLDSMYAQAEPDFFHLVEAFGGTKDDSALEANILKIHTFLRSHPYPDLWIDKKLLMFSDFETLNESQWGKIILSYTAEATQFLTSLVNSSFDAISYDAVLSDALTPLLEKDKDFASRLEFAINNPDTISLSETIKSFDRGKMPSVKGYKDNPLKVKVETNRSLFKDTVAKLCELFEYDINVCQRDVADLFVVSQQLFNCVRQFSENYQRLKAERKIADYPDLEHWTIKLLVDEKTLEFTDIARKLQSRFDQIMVDEYQDANEAQDLIFSALSNNDENLFFVGDVKQSIYGFRQAMPQLFLKRKDESGLYCENAPLFPAKILLDKNFRSIQGVTDAVNFFFEKLMSESVGDIRYNEEESLKCGAKFKEEKDPCVSYHMLQLSGDEESNADVEEAKYIAELIHKMISEKYQIKDGDEYRDVTYSDFAVLMRSAKSHANVYADTLIKCMVPAYCESSYSFLDAQEIMIMTNFLSVIDNPALDIELLSVMMSPVFGFTADDVTSIRCDSRYSTLYNAVLKKADSGDKKCKNFIDELSYYRDVCVTMPVHNLINTIYERSGFISIVRATPDSDNAVNNLLLLKEYAKTYEQGGAKGLSRFVSYINRLKLNGSDIAGAGDISLDNNNAVRIMSIHSSKGLEFPVCILANTARRFETDTKDNVLLHSQLGVAVKKRDEAAGILSSTMPREALSLQLKRDEKSEELRVLYVAMTRAKQKLIMLSSHKNVQSYLEKIGSKLTSNNSILPFVVRNSTLLCDWITMCALLHPDSSLLREIAMVDISPDVPVYFDMETKVVCLETDDEATEDDEAQDAVLFDTDNKVIDVLVSNVNFEYKKESLRNLPSKVSASELSHKMTDNMFSKILNTPAFMNDSKLTGASKGTALHAFLQFSDFVSAKTDIEAEITRLVNKGYLSQLQADSVDREKVSSFISSDLINRCVNSDTVFKEYRFTVEVSPSVVDPLYKDCDAEDKVILQGAVDLAFVEDNELVIVDYKTDNVKDINLLYDMYHKQLEIYKDAMEQCTDYKVKECLIYSIKHSEYITV